MKTCSDAHFLRFKLARDKIEINTLVLDGWTIALRVPCPRVCIAELLNASNSYLMVSMNLSRPRNKCIQAIHHIGGLEVLVNLLESGSNDAKCRLGALHVLSKISANNSEIRKLLVDFDAIPLLVAILIEPILDLKRMAAGTNFRPIRFKPFPT